VSKTSVFYRMVKAQKPHPFAGLYAIEKIYVNAGAITKKEIVKEWDLRILTEAALARFGGTSAYDEYQADNGEPEDMTDHPSGAVTPPRSPEELALTKRKLSQELKFKPE
jgi:hypothetical protein